MAKARAICKCAECGKTFEKTATKHNRAEANRWEEWAVQNYTQCPQCWGKEQRQKEQEKPLTLNVSINPYLLEAPIVLHFSGNTMPMKDKIKELGYIWGDMPMTGLFGPISMTRPPLCWYKLITPDEIKTELERAKEIGAAIDNKITAIDLATYSQIKAEADKKTAEQEEKLAQLKKPECPEVLKGARWNGKIYGKSGSYCIYCNNQKVNITDEQKEEIEAYLTAKAEYDKAVANILKN